MGDVSQDVTRARQLTPSPVIMAVARGGDTAGHRQYLRFCRSGRWPGSPFPVRSTIVEVEGETVAYVWGDRCIGIHHCPICGCGTHWKTLGEDFGRMGVHARLLDGFDPAKVEVRFMDNAG